MKSRSIFVSLSLFAATAAHSAERPRYQVQMPASLERATYESVELRVEARNARSYEWYKDGARIAGASGSALSINSVQSSDAGAYQARAVNGKYRIWSSPLQLTIGAPTPASHARELSRDGSFSRADAIAVLRRAAKSNVTTREHRLLNEVVADLAVPMPEHVRDLMAKVVGKHVANKFYRSGLLGNLEPNDSADKVEKLISKWFLGSDHPMIPSSMAGVAMPSQLAHSTAKGRLFVDGARYTDVGQGRIGDCYFITTLGALAEGANRLVTNQLFIDNGDGTFTVKLFSSKNGSLQPTYLTVDRNLVGLGGRPYFASSANRPALDDSNAEIWTGLLEKAYAQSSENFGATNSYKSIGDGGFMTTVFQEITGRSASLYSLTSAGASTAASEVAGGKMVTLASGNFGVNDGVYGNHAYHAYGYASSKFKLHNPWGRLHPSDLDHAQLQRNFTFAVTMPRIN